MFKKINSVNKLFNIQYVAVYNIFYVCRNKKLNYSYLYYKGSKLYLPDEGEFASTRSDENWQIVQF